MNREQALDYLVKNLDDWPLIGRTDDNITTHALRSEGWEWFFDGVFLKLGSGAGDISKLDWEQARETIKPDQPTFEQNPNYKQKDGGDLIDKWAVKYTREGFRAGMQMLVDKYYDRYGDKDSFVSESRKAADYANRLHLQEVKWAAEDNEVSE